MNIYEEIVAALTHENRVMLATVISATGSTPAPPASKMIVKNGGAVSAGTVGGGCMEGEVVSHANRLSVSGKSEIITFSLDEDDVESGLICGGDLDVLIEPVTREYLSMFQELKSLRDDGEDCILASLLSGEGVMEWKQLIPCSSGLALPLFSRIPHLAKDAVEMIKKAGSHMETQIIELPYGKLILEPISGSPALIIFGGGHISKHLAKAADSAGFRVTVVDDREKYANPVRFPEAAGTIVSDFDFIFDKLKVTPSTYLVIVTRGHKYDEAVLEQAVKSKAKYIGMIGSKRKILAAYDHLRSRGVTDSQIANVYAPVGIDIGAVTAEEISISIVSELVYVRRGKKRSLRPMSERINSLFLIVDGKSSRFNTITVS